MTRPIPAECWSTWPCSPGEGCPIPRIRRCEFRMPSYWRSRTRTTGEVFESPRVLAGFSLQEVGGPPINERPDETGLFADGRFADFSHLNNLSEQAGNFQNRQNNMLHSLSVTDDGGACLRRGRQRRVLRAQLGGDREPHRCTTWRRDGRLQSTLDDRVGERRDRCRQAFLARG